MRASVIAIAIVALAASVGLAPVGSAFAKGPESVAVLAETLSPAVVNISTSRHVPGMGLPYPDAPDGSPLGPFLDEHNPYGDMGEEMMEEARSLGSGFIIGAEGIVVTNNHVIEGAEQIDVFLTDGTRLPATVVGADAKMDLAVLKVDAGRDLPFVEFGDSDSAVVGDWVMAIGNPFGLGGSVTLGIVSARNRDIESGPYDQFIQTDAAINQGNSGGPLFDMDGKVVGINTAIIAQGGASLGIGFAVPVNLAGPVVQQLREFGETRRGWLGVGIQDVGEDIAASLGLDSTSGAMVISVTPGGPSEGVVKEGDIILKFDGREIARMRDLPRIVAETAVGKAVAVDVLRDGKGQSFTITLGRLEDGEKLVAGAAPVDSPVVTDDGEPVDASQVPAELTDIVGFDVAAVDEANRAQFGLPPESDGIVVTDVRQGSDADTKGLLPGLRITEVNQKQVSTVDTLTDLVNAARDAGKPAVLFKLVDPAGQARFVAVLLG